MSERILKALMHLFAVLAKVDEVNFLDNKGRTIVHSFLKDQLGRNLVNEYLNLFDEYVAQYNNLNKITKVKTKRKKASLSSVKILLICTQINEELTQKQKVIVLIRLIEFMIANGEPNPQDIEFITTVSATFNIKDEEYQKFTALIESDIDSVPDIEDFLIINNDTTFHASEKKHITSETLDGNMFILRIPSVNMYICRYLGSKELYLNGQIIQKNRVYVITVGSSIRSTKVNPIYYSDILAKFLSDNTKEKLTFSVEHITYCFPNGYYGINDMSISEQSGRLVGIMGASGAGKTTLLTLLNGTSIPTSGKVLINGIDLHDENEKEELKGLIGHISQDDLLIEDLTVFQNLYYNAKLCFDGWTEEQITERVDEVLNNLGLYHVKDLKVGSPMNKKISGGQRKRLNIALELIREPSILFVDEPTSGLSSRDSENVMDLLKELALKGKLIFVVIHQPSSDIFKMFDKLVILDTGGYLSYYGDPVDSIIYFKSITQQANFNEGECERCGNVNPEQIFNILEAKVVDEFGNHTKTRKISPKEWNKLYKIQLASKLEKFKSGDGLPRSIFKVPNKLKQFYVFIVRDVLSKLANTQYISINLLETPVLAFILAYVIKFYNVDVATTEGYVFRENENLPVYLFMCIIVALFVGLTVSAEEIFKDQKILKREKFLNLSKSSYLFSKITIMFVLSAIQTFTFIIVGNTVLEIEDMLLNYWLILFSTSAFANMLGLNISSAFNSVVTIYIIIPFIIIPQLLLSGVMVPFSKLNPSISQPNTIPLIGEVMTSRWAYEAIAVTQFRDNKYERNYYKFDKAMSDADFKKNFWIPRLRAKLDKCQSSIKNIEKKEEIEDDLTLIRNEFLKETVRFHNIDSLYINKISPRVFGQAKEYLNAIYNINRDIYNKNNSEKDKSIIANQKKLGKDEFNRIKKDYQNKSLSDYVTNSNELNRIVEFDQELFQQIDPVYLYPEHDKFLKAHFYAPKKKIFGKLYDTYWVNIIVIWVMAIALYFTLYFDIFRKILESGSGIVNIVSNIPQIISKIKFSKYSRKS